MHSYNGADGLTAQDPSLDLLKTTDEQYLHFRNAPLTFALIFRRKRLAQGIQQWTGGLLHRSVRILRDRFRLDLRKLVYVRMHRRPTDPLPSQPFLPLNTLSSNRLPL